MTTEQNKAALRRWVEAFNAKDINLFDRLADEIYTTDYTLHDPASPYMGRGPESIKKFIRQIFQDNSDAHMVVEDVFGEGNKLAYRCLIQLTDASTGKTVSFPILVISHFVGGQFAEEWEIAGPPVG